MKPADLFYVVGEHKNQKAFYCGWWHTYAQPLLAPNQFFDVKRMKRANANRVCRRLRNPKIWGGDWRLEKV